jgi:hypothetical protein
MLRAFLPKKKKERKKERKWEKKKKVSFWINYKASL